MIQNKINADLKTAMLEKDVAKRDLLRVIIGEMNRVGKELDDATVTGILKKMKDNAELVGNADEAVIIESYLPTMMTEAEVDNAVNNIIASLRCTSIKDMGTVMGALKTQCGGSYDGKYASISVRTALSKL